MCHLLPPCLSRSLFLQYFSFLNYVMALAVLPQLGSLLHHSHPGLAEASPRCVANYRNPYYEQARLWVRWQVLAFRNVAASHSNYGLFSAFILQTQRAFMPHMLHGKLFWCIASGTEDTILLCLGWSGKWQSVQKNPSLV